MPAYGSHPTRFSALTDDQLYMGFRPSTWSKLNDGIRLDLMQEAVNRSAAAHGEAGSCQVIWDSSLSDHTMGAQRDGMIRVNPAHYSGEGSLPLPDLPRSVQSWSALETVLHEDEHAFQEQAIDGTIPLEDQELLKQYRSNGFDISTVDTMAGKRQGLQYININSNDRRDYLMYYLQATERDAHRFSQEKASAIMERQQALSRLDTGMDPQARAFDEQAAKTYRAYLSANSYENICQEANEAFFTKDFEHDLNTTLVNCKYGENSPLEDPSIQGLVHASMNQSLLSRQRGARSEQAIPHGEPTESAALGYDWENQTTWPQLGAGLQKTMGGSESETAVKGLSELPMSTQDLRQYCDYLQSEDVTHRPEPDRAYLTSCLGSMTAAYMLKDKLREDNAFDMYAQARQSFLDYDAGSRQRAEMWEEGREAKAPTAAEESARGESAPSPEAEAEKASESEEDGLRAAPEEKSGLDAARGKAVKDAWKMEADRIRDGRGTWDWTVEQQAELLSTGRVSGFEGSHMLSAKDYPEHAGNPANIQLIPSIAHYDGVHERNPRANTPNGVYHPDTGEVTPITDGKIPELPEFDLTDRYEPDQQAFHDAHPAFEQSGESRNQGYKETKERHPEKSIGKRGAEKPETEGSTEAREESAAEGRETTARNQEDGMETGVSRDEPSRQQADEKQAAGESPVSAVSPNPEGQKAAEGHPGAEETGPAAERKADPAPGHDAAPAIDSGSSEKREAESQAPEETPALKADGKEAAAEKQAPEEAPALKADEREAAPEENSRETAPQRQAPEDGFNFEADSPEAAPQRQAPEDGFNFAADSRENSADRGAQPADAGQKAESPAKSPQAEEEHAPEQPSEGAAAEEKSRSSDNGPQESKAQEMTY